MGQSLRSEPHGVFIATSLEGSGGKLVVPVPHQTCLRARHCSQCPCCGEKVVPGGVEARVEGSDISPSTSQLSHQNAQIAHTYLMLLCTLCTCPMRQVPLTQAHYHRWGNQGTEQWNNLLKIIEAEPGLRAGSWVPEPSSLPATPARDPCEQPEPADRSWAVYKDGYGYKISEILLLHL